MVNVVLYGPFKGFTDLRSDVLSLLHPRIAVSRRPESLSKEKPYVRLKVMNAFCSFFEALVSANLDFDFRLGEPSAIGVLVVHFVFVSVYKTVAEHKLEEFTDCERLELAGITGMRDPDLASVLISGFR